MRCLPKVFVAWISAHPRSTLHHGSVWSHTEARTLEFLQENQFRVLPHPAYFPELEGKLRGRRFETSEEATTAYNKEVK